MLMRQYITDKQNKNRKPLQKPLITPSQARVDQIEQASMHFVQLHHRWIIFSRHGYHPFWISQHLNGSGGREEERNDIYTCEGSLQSDLPEKRV